MRQQIKALELVIAYLEGRGDAEIVLTRLRLDLNTFESYREARKRKFPVQEGTMKDEYIVVHTPTGETIQTGFETESNGYNWLKSECENHGLEPHDINEYAVERLEED